METSQLTSKPVLIGAAVVVVALVMIFAFSGSDGGSSSSSSSLSSGSLSEKERYALFEAESLCTLLVESESELASALAKIPQIAAKHGFTEQEVNTLSVKYENDAGFEKLAEDEARKLCPEKF